MLRADSDAHIPISLRAKIAIFNVMLLCTAVSTVARETEKDTWTGLSCRERRPIGAVFGTNLANFGWWYQPTELRLLGMDHMLTNFSGGGDQAGGGGHDEPVAAGNGQSDNGWNSRLQTTGHGWL